MEIHISRKKTCSRFGIFMLYVYICCTFSISYKSTTPDFINNKYLRMKSSTNLNQRSYLTDLYSTNAVKSRRLSLLMLMLLTLLFVPTRMVAQTTTDPRCALFNDLDGITDVTITDDGDYPWQMLNLGADGMTNLGFTIPDGSKGLMSSNYNKDNSKSKSIVKFRVEKPILLPQFGIK